MSHLNYRVGALSNPPSPDASYVFIGIGKTPQGHWMDTKPYGTIEAMARDIRLRMFHGVSSRMYHPPKKVRFDNQELAVRPFTLDERLSFQKALIEC